MTIFAYSRVSTDRQATDGISLDMQARQLAGWAQMTGRALDATFADAGVSGSIPVGDRPEGAAMLARVRKGDAVVAVKLDRLFRNALDALQTVEKLRQKGVALFLLDLGNDDVCSNGMAKMFLTVAAAFAEGERDRIRERVRGSKAHQKADGKYLGGKVPYGFTVDAGGALVPVPEQQAIISRAKALRAGGAVLRVIQKELAEGENGKRLSLDAISRITGDA